MRCLGSRFHCVVLECVVLPRCLFSVRPLLGTLNGNLPVITSPTVRHPLLLHFEFPDCSRAPSKSLVPSREDHFLDCPPSRPVGVRFFLLVYVSGMWDLSSNEFYLVSGLTV